MLKIKNKKSNLKMTHSVLLRVILNKVECMTNQNLKLLNKNTLILTFDF